MYEYADNNGHIFYLAQDISKRDGTSAKRYTSLPSYDDYLELASRTPTTNMNFNEVLRTQCPTKPIFDLEWYGFSKDAKNTNPMAVLHYIIEHIKIAFYELYDVQIEDNDLRLLESHMVENGGVITKYSYHLSIQGYIWENIEQGIHVYRKLEKSIDWSQICTLDKHNKRDIAVDPLIYRKNSCVRMLGNHKNNDVTRKLRKHQNHEHYSDGDFILTNIESGIVMLPFIEDIQPVLPPEISGCATLKTPTTNTFDDHSAKYDIGDISSLLDMLHDKRAYDRMSWMSVKWVLHSLDHTSDDLCALWHKFSQRGGDKYSEYDCHKEWMLYQYRDPEHSYNLGSLRNWAKLDNPEAYKLMYNKPSGFKASKQQLSKVTTDTDSDINTALQSGHILSRREALLNQALSLTNRDVAKYVLTYIDEKLLCCDGFTKSQKLWFKFENHRWKECDGSMAIGSVIENEILGDVADAILTLNTHRADTATFDANLDKQISLYKKLLKSLKTSAYVNGLLPTCKISTYKSDALSLFDENIDLFGCKNGVYDLKNNKFSSGRAEDFITISTGIDFQSGDEHGDYNDNHPYIECISQFMQEIQPDAAVRQYLETMLGSCLYGKNVKEHAYIFEGSGSNGKSKLLELVGHALGGYAGTLAMSYFTGKKTQSSAATPEIEAIAKARLVTSTETDEDERFNVGILKQNTGNDPITYRGLNKPIVTTTPKFVLIFAVNHLPKLSESDGGIWRRIRRIKFLSQFKEHPDPKNPREFKRNDYLSDDLFKWRHAFLWLLFQWHQNFRIKGLKDIPEVLQSTEEYQQNQDPIKKWLKDNVEKTDDRNDYVCVKHLKAKLMEAKLYRTKFKKDCDFVTYIKAQYPDCEHSSTQERVGDVRVTNFMRNLKFIAVDELDKVSEPELI